MKPAQLRLVRFMSLLMMDGPTQKRFNRNASKEMKDLGLSLAQQKLIKKALEGEGFRKLLATFKVPGDRGDGGGGDQGGRRG